MTTLEEWSCMPESYAALGEVAVSGGGLFTLAVQALLAAQCALVHPDNNPRDRTDDILSGKREFDFIVVGAGSAGSVVASRLSEVEDWEVLLIEAGGDPLLINEVPILFYQNLNTTNDWQFPTEPNERVCLGTRERKCMWPRGKLLGGCSAINAMIYTRGNKNDYEQWEDLGNVGWGYDNVLKYFKKSENFNGDEDYYNQNQKYHGKDGYLNVEKFNINDSLSNIIIKGQKELGTKLNYENNGPEQIGISKGFFTIQEGKRMSTAKAFLNPVKERKNLYVIKNAQVIKITMNKPLKKATGVEVRLNNGKHYMLTTKKEVVLSGGSISTPHLLLLSGIGPRKHLKEKNIDIVYNLRVGENLQDHIVAPVFFEVKRGTLKEFSQEAIGISFVNYLAKQMSELGTVLSGEVVQFINTRNDDTDTPDIQYHYIPVYPNDTLFIKPFFSGLGYTKEASESVINLNKETFLFMVYTVLLKPKSRGKLMLRDSNPLEYPLIYPNYYEAETDMETMLKGMEFMEKLADTKTFIDENIKLVKLDYAPCSTYDLRTNEYRKCIAQHYGFTLYHPVGTAKMGIRSDPTSVVDNKLRVHGVKGLRVADASVMPVITRGNTNAPTIMIGERASDFIKEEYLQLRDEL